MCAETCKAIAARINKALRSAATAIVEIGGRDPPVMHSNSVAQEQDTMGRRMVVEHSNDVERATVHRKAVDGTDPVSACEKVGGTNLDKRTADADNGDANASRTRGSRPLCVRTALNM